MPKNLQQSDPARGANWPVYYMNRPLAHEKNSFKSQINLKNHQWQKDSSNSKLNSKLASKDGHIETFNCDHGCPCNFSGFPTYGCCRALVLDHIQDGNYGDYIRLDGLDIIHAVSWLKAIHEGNGILHLFIS